MYVCGEAKNMARDVHRALIELYKKRDAKAAEAKIKLLSDEGRYQKDVW